VNGVNARKLFWWCLLLGVFGLCRAAARCDGIERGASPCVVGETLRYNIYVAGFKIGTQTVTIASAEELNGREVYRIRGSTETSGISKLFHGYRDMCTAFVDAATLRPVLIERTVEEKGRVCRYTYAIDQEKRTMTVRDWMKGETKVVHPGNVVFDQLSLCYFYRSNPALFEGRFSFDLLKKDSVITVYMRQEGLVTVHMPRLPSGDATPALKYVEEGGGGIEIYIGVDGFSVPLKVVFRTALEEKRKNTVVELYLRDCDAYPEIGVPIWYRELVKRTS
jgi:hypothetical protein